MKNTESKPIVVMPEQWKPIVIKSSPDFGDRDRKVVDVKKLFGVNGHIEGWGGLTGGGGSGG